MRGPGHGLRTAWRVVRAEGWRAAVDRARDRLDERRERRSARAAAPGSLGRTPVLNALGMPLSRRLGGAPTQLRNRLALERRERPCVVLHPDGSGWRLEYADGAERRFLVQGPAPLAVALRWGLEQSGAAALHCEGMAGLSGDVVGALAGEGVRLVISLHDLSLFANESDEPRKREGAATLLRSAEAVVFPSLFLRDAHLEWLGGLAPERVRVIEPGTPPAPYARIPDAVTSGVRHVAWVGAVHAQKGALVFEDVVRRLQESHTTLRLTALGGGDAGLLARFRALPRLTVRGYYRAGSLPEHLRRMGVDLALLLSVAPEAYGLTLDECWRAGVPAIAFDHGAMAERIRRLGGGLLVDPAEGAEGIVRAIRRAMDGPPPAVPGPDRLPHPAQAARAHLALYRDLGLLEGRSA